LQYAGSFISQPFKALGNLANNLTASEEDLTSLRDENEELRARIMQMEEYRLENDRLSSLLALSNAYSLEATGARVISRSTDSWNQVLTIDKGSVDGVQLGMPVMSANGLIGQIENVSPFSSVVRLISDEHSGVAVFLQVSRTEGVVTGSVEGLLYLRYIPLNVLVIPGDVVITSGAAGVYPKGIAIGEVVSVTHAAADVYQSIIIKPITRVSTYEEVLILTGGQAEVTLNSDVLTGSTGGNGTGATGDSLSTPNATDDTQTVPQGDQRP
jgi:rod shape-determining protein MreC